MPDSFNGCLAVTRQDTCGSSGIAGLYRGLPNNRDKSFESDRNRQPHGCKRKTGSGATGQYKTGQGPQFVSLRTERSEGRDSLINGFATSRPGLLCSYARGVGLFAPGCIFGRTLAELLGRRGNVQ